MSFQLKRIVFFFCILYFMLSCFPGNRANAQGGEIFRLFLGAISNEYGYREITGTVLYNGNGLAGVRIYPKEGDSQYRETITDGQGFFRLRLTQGVEKYIIPNLLGYQFLPASILIPKDRYSHDHNNFTAQKQALVTISGNVKNVVWNTQRPFTATMRADSETSGLTSSNDTNVDGNYSLSVPVGWTGDVTPEGSIFKNDRLSFIPRKKTYSGLNVNKLSENYEVCHYSEILGLWKFLDPYSINVGYGDDLTKFVGKLVTLTEKQERLKFKVGEEVWWLNRETCQFSGQVAWRDSYGNYWKESLTVRIEGDQMFDSNGKVIGTR